MHSRYVLLVQVACLAVAAALTPETCEQPPLQGQQWDYSPILSQGREQGLTFDDLPGFTRSSYQRNWALITPESRVFSPNPLWQNAVTAHLISPVIGANFAMYLAKMAANATALDPSGGVPAPLQRLERFVFVLTGEVTVKAAKHEAVVLGANQFAYLPRDMSHVIMSETGAELMVFERKHRGADVRGAGKAAAPVFLHGDVEAQPVLPVGGEVFVLRKLLPQTVDYDFNVHVMDFMPGEYLNVKEVHYNQHGLLLLQGKGVYRLGNHWMPVQTGDAIWMAPYVPQWYAALGTTPSRYILYKDTAVDPVDE